MPSYAYSTIATLVRTKVKGTVSDANLLVLVNEAAREVAGDLDLRSTRRKSTLSPNLFSDIYDYSAPTDLKAWAIVDVRNQVNRALGDRWALVPNEEFDSRKTGVDNLITVDDHDFIRKIRISKHIDDKTLTISTLDTITSGGTWALFGDGTNLTSDSDNFVTGNGSVNWDISSAGGTTAGIQSADLTVFDFTDYTYSSGFVWAYIQDTTNITNFILRVGNDSSNYYTKTVTTTNEGAAFTNGWNLLRFDIATATTVGTLTLATFNYAVIYMTKDGAKVSETDYRFDHIVFKRGQIFDVHYYSKYMWQSSGGTYLEDSANTTDLLNADTEEVDLVTLKASALVSDHLDNDKDAERYDKKYEKRRENYGLKYPSEAMLITSTYYDFGSVGRI